MAAGTVTICDEPHLRAALAGGGLVTIAADGMIALTNTIAITNGTILDASGHQFTLSGHGAVQVLQVNSGAQFVISNVTVIDGFASGVSGGGMQNSGDATVVNCTFSNNVSVGSLGFTFGGAIDHQTGALNLLGCTFIKNSASTSGGAIASGYNVFSGHLRITNCTFYANTAGFGSGGAISIHEPLAETIWIVNCTFASNTNGAVDEPNLLSSVRANLINNIFANSVGGPNAAGNLVDLGYNISSDNSTVFTHFTSLTNTNPQLGLLANNGGPTLTLLPQPGSPAIDGGNSSAGPLADQRGIARPQGVFSDIGAVESTVAGTSAGSFTFTVATNNVTETNALLSFTVWRAGGVAGAVSVNFATSNGTAIAGQDFVATNGSLAFAANQRSNTFSIQLLDDAQVEPLETFYVTLTNATGGAVLFRPVSAVNVTDNDVGVSFSSTDFNVSESAGNAVITVNRTGLTGSAVSVDYAVHDGTAIAGADYQGTSGTLNFGSGQTNATFNVVIDNDTLLEGSETVLLALSNPVGASLGTPAAATLTILDDEIAAPGQLQFGNANYSVDEAAGQALISVVRTGGNNVPVTVHYATSDGTAVSGQDYTTTSGTLTFAAGETVKFFAVPVLANAPVEGSETVNLTLSSPTGGASLGAPASAVLTIVDGDLTVPGCSEAFLRLAVGLGGRVVLPCDGTIFLTSPIIISNSVLIDASGHAAVLSGSNATQLFIVNPGVTLALRGVTLADGLVTDSTALPGLGGAIRNNEGQVLLTDCSFLRNTAVGGISSSGLGNYAGNGFGGAIYSSNGIVWATNTLFKANQAKGGQGTLNGASGGASGGALYQTGGASLLWNCHFESNVASSPIPTVNFVPNFADGGQASGGAVFHTNGVLTLIACDFVTNVAAGGPAFRVGIPGAGRGGAIYSGSELMVNGCDFIQNFAAAGNFGPQGTNGEGGALFLTQPAIVSASLFQNNSVRGGQGYAGSIVPFPGGFGFGGAIYNPVTLILTDSTLVSNQAVGADGARGAFGAPTSGTSAAGGAVFNNGVLYATNVTFAGNQSRGGAFPDLSASGQPETSGGNAYGGGVSDAGGTVVLVYTTFADNSAIAGKGSPDGIGFGGGIQNSNGAFTALGSIIANSPSGGNASGALTDSGHNLSSDSSCNFSSPGSLNNSNPVLGPLDNYGGPTPTLPLLAGSPAINGGDNASFPPTDQRGRARPFGSGPDIGAFESSPPYTIHGVVSGNTFKDEVSVTAGSTTVSTINHGTYSAGGLAANTYSVTPTSVDYLFLPGNRAVTVGPDQTGINFKAYHWNTLSLDDVTNDTLHIVFAVTNVSSFRLLTSSNLIQWVPVATNSVGVSNYSEIFIPVGTERARFYRTISP